MNSYAKPIKSHRFTAGDRLFFDTNIWLSIYFPEEVRSKKRHYHLYSLAFKGALEAKSQLFTDVLIMSEFLNAYSRKKFNIFFKNEFKNFKEFRNSKKFVPIAEEIASVAKAITGRCSLLDSGFADLKIDEALNKYAEGRHDFNDQVIAELCSKEKLILVTHDGDFKSCSVPLLTANQKLLD